MSAADPDIAGEKYVSFTTFRKSGEPKSLPVWIVGLGDGTSGFTTSSGSWKVKRLANDPRVELQPSDSRGKLKPGSQKVTGTAVVVTGAEFDRVQSAISAKYKLMAKGIQLMSKLGSLVGRADAASNCAIVVTLD